MPLHYNFLKCSLLLFWQQSSHNMESLLLKWCVQASDMFPLLSFSRQCLFIEIVMNHNLKVLTWWNIASVSATFAILLFRNLRRTPIKLFSKSGPVHSDQFNLSPLFLAAASNATLILSSFLGLKREWCGRYQVLLVTFILSSSVNFLA